MSVGKKLPVICIDTGKVYASQRSAARDLGVTVTAVNHVITGRSIMVRGQKFRYANGDEIYEWNLSQPKRLDREEWKALAIELGKTLGHYMNLLESSDCEELAKTTLSKLDGVI